MLEAFSLDRIEGELEAGFAFAAAAEEFRSDREKFAACISDALECYGYAVRFLGHPALTTEQRQILGVNLSELQRRLDLLREKKLSPSAAA
jgi:hypothetical protein